MKPYRVLHFVAGGGSGSTNVVTELAAGHESGPLFEPMVVFRGPIPETHPFITNPELQKIKYSCAPWNPKAEMVSRLCEAVKTFKPHVLAAHGYREHIYGRSVAVKARVPVIISVEHNLTNYWLEPHRYVQSQFLSRFTSDIICVSHGVADSLQHSGFNPKKLHVIYNGFNQANLFGVSTQPQPFSRRSANVIMASRFSREKDQPTLVKAVKLLKDMGKNCDVYFAGDGKYKNGSEILCEELGIKDRTFFLGHLTHAKLFELLNTNQIFVLSSKSEGLPMAIIEAMSLGCLVIASNIPGVCEIIRDGQTGFLVPPGDPPALAAKIKLALENRELAETLAENGKKWVFEHFSAQRMTDQYERLFLTELSKIKFGREKILSESSV
jgi:glycosyltransferase involved in cell wall biosynthesis